MCFIITLECLGKSFSRHVECWLSQWKQQSGMVERITYTSSRILDTLLTLSGPLCPNLENAVNDGTMHRGLILGLNEVLSVKQLSLGLVHAERSRNNSYCYYLQC